MEHVSGLVEYAYSWRWHALGEIVTESGFVCEVKAMPLRVDDSGGVVEIGVMLEADDRVFEGREQAYFYLRALARRDLEYRGFRNDRCRSFEYHCDALFHLHERVLRCDDEVEYRTYKAEWEQCLSGKYESLAWSPEQPEVLRLVDEATGMEDEAEKMASERWL